MDQFWCLLVNLLQYILPKALQNEKHDSHFKFYSSFSKNNSQNSNGLKTHECKLFVSVSNIWSLYRTQIFKYSKICEMKYNFGHLTHPGERKFSYFVTKDNKKHF